MGRPEHRGSAAGGPPTASIAGSSVESLSVLGQPRRSVFDSVRPDEIATIGAKLRGPGGMALACLQQNGITGGLGRPQDTVVLGGRTFGTPHDCWTAAPESTSLAIAYGMARSTGIWRRNATTWCLARTRALDVGDTLEAVAVIGRLPGAGLVTLLVGPTTTATRSTQILAAFGMAVHHADNDDAWSVLSAIDHAVADSRDRAAVVVATRPPRP